MKSLFLNLHDDFEEEIDEKKTELMIRNALSRCGFHVFRSEYQADNTEPKQVLLNSKIEVLTCFVSVNSRINIKTIAPKKAVIVFLP